MAGLLNPAMKEDLTKIRGLAVGLVDIGPSGPSLAGVLHLGESGILRGLIMTGLSIAGAPGETVEGMQTYSIQGQIDIGCDDKVVLMSIPPGRLPEMIRQYKHFSSDASLARDNASFKQLDKAGRQQNLATLWVNTDDLYACFARQMPDRRQEIWMGPVVVDMAPVDDLLLTASLATDAIGLDGRIRFKEGTQNMIYEMIRTPSIHREGLRGVPADAIGLLSFDLADSGSMQAAQLRQLAMSSFGVDVPASLFDSIEQVSLFALPCPGITKREMPFRPGLVVHVKDRTVAEQFVQSIRTTTDGMGLIVEVVDGAVLAAMEPEVVAAAKEALTGGASVNNGGALKATADRYADAAQKMALVGIGGIVRLAPYEFANRYPAASEELTRQVEGSFSKLAKELDGTTLAIHTEESPRELVLKVQLGGIPKLGSLADSIQQINQTMTKVEEAASRMQAEARRKYREEQLARLVPATVVKTTAVPAIDGEREGLWDEAPVYKVGKTVSGIHDREQGKPIAGNEFAADFRMLWNAEKLYVFMDVTDSTPNHNPQLGWQFSDNAVLYIDATDSKSERFGSADYEYAFCWDASAPVMNEKKHGRTENIAYKIKTTEKGYCVEAAFPWATLGTPDPKAGTVIGVDVQVSDNQAGPQRNLLLGWQDDTNGAWQQPVLFGRAVLAGNGE
jgi:hypothetical protein